ncbi:DUF3953 domain-containing protein [Aquibacillus koreensis]|uniref:DUF3953 domain-containing protein n=1 Tax=Aquibacillus koreensis TaxID=279446 RepID=A0A9X3WLP1_9BACI|nr:DUF3953 domain-containing protein [Aquibacillus koreensis]MCT2536466.1 DUF3953 domain-containing protein [Aquibacillus koreensis]MDC3419446.1 DUF3953 domain-containing protein [Aquibacillus koreensis]
MKILRVILAITVVSLAGYSLITDEYGLIPYTLLILGLLLVVMGINEILEKRKITALICFLAAGFDIFVSLDILFG